VLLGISTSTEALSVALWDGGHLVGAIHDIIGRGHAERLLPAIAEVVGNARADEILVDCGPGSFTGVRVGIAAARGLGLAWNAPVHGFSSLPLIAATVDAPGPFAIANRAGHGEVFFQMFTPDPFRSLGDARSVPPDEGRTLAANCPAWGTGAELVAGERGLSAHPDVRHLPALPAPFRRLAPRPLYLRAPDAKRPA